MIAACLRPASYLYGGIMGARNWFYDSAILPAYTSSLPVVCVGNVTAGGNGKTPLTVWLAEQLKGTNRRPVVLSRGYGGRQSGPQAVGSRDLPEDVGDEPLMMVRNHGLTVVIAKDRVEGAKFIEQHKLGDFIILDDGLQHRRLARSKNILAIDVSSRESVEELLSGKLLPWGRLREPLEVALKRTQVIVLNHRGPEQVEFAKQVRDHLPKNIPIFETYMSGGEFFDLSGQKVSPPSQGVVVCGLGHPAGFISSVEANGCHVIAKHLFDDHQSILVREVQKIKSTHPELPIVISSKDRVRVNDAGWGAGVLEFRGVLTVRKSEEFLKEVLE